MTIVVLASPLAASSSISGAVFGILGALIGGFIAGAVSLLVARQTREAAERSWIRDNRREIYDRFLSRAQGLLIACEVAHESEGDKADATVKAADTQFFEAYVVVQTVADLALVHAARVYGYRLWELEAMLNSTSVMGPENFNRVGQLVRE